MEAHALTPGFGSEVVGLDLTAPLSPDERDQLRRIFADRQILLFRGQDLTPDDQVRAVSYLAPPADNNGTLGSYYSYVSNAVDAGLGGLGELLFHSDFAFTPAFTLAISLYGDEINPGSADTTFASSVNAFDRLPADLRRRLEGRSVRNIIDNRIGHEPSRFSLSLVPPDALPMEFPSHVHTVFGQDPFSHRAAIQAMQLFSHVADLPEEESEALLDDLWAVLYDPAYLYVHHWQHHDLLLWDNVALQHARSSVGVDAPRTLRRVAAARADVLSRGPIEWTPPGPAILGGTAKVKSSSAS